jgi:hypothetical protein
MEDNKKKWRARVVQTIRANGDDGSVVTLAPGDYTLSETGDARYQLTQNSLRPASSSLWFAEVQLCAYMGQVEILGVWP